MSEYAVGFRTDVGRQRTANEDAGAVFDAPHCDVAFVVCDGMGGLSAGDVASNEAVRVVRDTLMERFSDPDADPLQILGDALRIANDAVNEGNRAERASRRASGEQDSEAAMAEAGDEGRALMGTTCVAGVIRGGELFLAHAGDSRAYLWRGGRLIRLTDDHSFVGERVKAGDMTEAEAKKSRFRNIVTRAIGIEEMVQPELRRQLLEAGDLLLVCTDGLTTMADDSEIAGMLFAPSLRTASPERIAEVLIDAANRRGGSDNITALAVRVPGAAFAAIDSAMRGPSGRNGEAKREMIATRDNKRQKGASPFGASSLLPALVGAGATLLALLLALALIPSLRERLAATSGDISRSGVISPQSSVARTDFSHLTYEKPIAFAEMLARGDLLSYVPGVGLYYVGGSSGNILLLDESGKPKTPRPVDTIGIVGREADAAIPATRAYMTTDVQGNVYLSLTPKRVIVKKSPEGVTLATIAGFDRPEAIDVDERGNIYVVDWNQIKICRARDSAALPSSASPTATGTPTPSGPPSPAPSASAKKPIR